MSKPKGSRWPNTGHFEQCFEHTEFKKVCGYILLFPPKIRRQKEGSFHRKRAINNAEKPFQFSFCHFATPSIITEVGQDSSVRTTKTRTVTGC